MAPKIIDLRHIARAPRQAGRGNRAQPSRPPHKRHEPLRARRRRVRIYAILASLLGLIVVAYGLHWISYRPSLRIGEISVRGATTQNPDDVTAHVQAELAQTSWRFFPRDSIFFYPKKELQASVATKFPRLKSARIGRGSVLGTQLIVNVDERVPYATWCRGNVIDPALECFVFDENGYIFAPLGSHTTDVSYAFVGGVEGEPVGKLFANGQLPELLKYLKVLEQEGFRPLRIWIENERDFAVLLQNGFSIKASFGQDTHVLLGNLKLVSVSPALRGREGELEYIDLRFGNRVYYKFKNQEAPIVEE